MSDMNLIGPDKAPLRYCPPGTRQMVLGLTPFRTPVAGDRAMMSHPIRASFLPLGRYVHGADDSTFLLAVRAGNQHQEWSDRIPARHFSTGKSFDELRRLAELGEISPLPHQLFEMDVLDLGNQLSIEMEGVFTGVTVWGLTYQHRGPYETVVVTKESDHYEGAVVRHGIRGNEGIFRVSAPSEDSVCRLLEGRQSRTFL